MQGNNLQIWSLLYLKVTKNSSYRYHTNFTDIVSSPSWRKGGLLWDVKEKNSIVEIYINSLELEQ